MNDLKDMSGIDKSELKDLLDLVELAKTYINPMRCAGNRWVSRTYRCMHCGSVDPHNECGKPKNE